MTMRFADTTGLVVPRPIPEARSLPFVCALARRPSSHRHPIVGLTMRKHYQPFSKFAHENFLKTVDAA